MTYTIPISEHHVHRHAPSWSHPTTDICTLVPAITDIPQRKRESSQTWQSAETSVTRSSQTHIELIERLYLLHNRIRILSFLEAHPFLVDVLLESYGIIQRYFPGVRIHLQTASDPDEQHNPQLVLYIIANGLNPDAALKQLAKLDENWWLDALQRVRGKMFINLTME